MVNDLMTGVEDRNSTVEILNLVRSTRVEIAYCMVCYRDVTHACADWG